MKNLLRSSWAKKAVLFAFVVGLVSPAALAQQYAASNYTGASVNTYQAGSYTGSGADVTDYTALPNSGSTPEYTSNNYSGSGLVAQAAPQVQGLTISPNPYDVDEGNATVSFSLNTTATTTVWIKDDNNTIVRTLLFDTDLVSGQTYDYTWQGYDDKDNEVADGDYKVQVVVYNDVDTDTANYPFTVDSNGGGTGETCEIIGSYYVYPDEIDPSDSDEDEIRLTFRLDRDAEVTINVLDRDNDEVDTILDNDDLNEGTHNVYWYGEDEDGDEVRDGYYEFEIIAEVSGCDDDKEYVDFDVDSNGRDDEDDWDDDREGLITDLEVDPDVIDPDDNERTKITFELTDDVDRLVVQAVDGDEVLYEIADRTNQDEDDYTFYWDGEDEDGDEIDDGKYDIRVMAEDEDGDTDADRACIVIDTDGRYTACDDDDEDDWPSTDEDLIDNVYVDNEIFDPTDGERSRINFELTDDVEELKVQVVEFDSNKVIETLRDAEDVSEGEYSYAWDGRDKDGDLMDDDLYEFRIMADSGDETDTDRAFTELDTDGIIIGFPSYARCAGFKDVSIYSPFCKAIELMSADNIFDGYPDGTFRPYKAINRAETVKVVTLALDYDVETGGFYGRQFSDTSGSAWYAPYLEVALDNGIIHGYPDGTFRPSNTVNRVELLKIFLEAHNLGRNNCSYTPYNDMQNSDWFAGYACYAKQNNLITGDMLRPAEAMTRGDVADLFYAFEKRGEYAEYDRPTGYNYEYYDNYNDYYDRYDREDDGYYVYRNGRYEWVSY